MKTQPMNLATISVCLLFCLGFACPTVAWQERVAPVYNPQEAFNLLREGKTMAAMAVLEEAMRSSESSGATDDMLLQELATVRSFAGDHRGALQAKDRSGPSSGQDPQPNPVNFNGIKPFPALQTIIDLARDRQIVIINEAHHVPQHRAFSTLLAVQLRELGFEYIAMEALNPDTKSLSARGFPDRNTGYYTMEPVFGDFVRTALQLGYTPVPYEMIPTAERPKDMTDQINRRETAQCQNLVDRIFAKNPDAKVLIHCGYSHATEDTKVLPDGRETKWMAARLKEATGIDPLTIDQTEHSPRSKNERSSQEWQQALQDGLLNKDSIVLQHADGSWWTSGRYAGKVDLQILHPPVQWTDGRPNWLLALPDRKIVAVPDELKQLDQRCLIKAFLESESESAIPVDQFIFEPGSSKSLVLPPGSFRIEAENEQGETIGRTLKKVE